MNGIILLPVDVINRIFAGSLAIIITMSIMINWFSYGNTIPLLFNTLCIILWLYIGFRPTLIFNETGVYKSYSIYLIRFLKISLNNNPAIGYSICDESNRINKLQLHFYKSESITIEKRFKEYELLNLVNQFETMKLITSLNGHV